MPDRIRDLEPGPLVPPWEAMGDCHPWWRVRVMGDWRVMGFWRCKRHRECLTCADHLADDKLERWVPVLEEAGAVYVATKRLDGSTWAERRAAGVDEREWLKSLQKSTRRLRDSIRERLNDRGATGYLRTTVASCWTRRSGRCGGVACEGLGPAGKLRTGRLTDGCGEYGARWSIVS